MERSVNVLYWKVRSFFREIYKMKFKALFRYFYDSEYRSDINYMLNLVRQSPVTCIETEVKLGNIVSCHDLNYPDWVMTLRKQIRSNGASSLPPIKVFLDVSKQKYLVVDGNHRLSALMSEVGPFYRIKVILLSPVKQTEVLHESI